MLHDYNDAKYLVHFGKTIKAARKARNNETQESVAEAVGIQQAKLSHIEKGECTSLEYITVIRLYLYLQIPWADLYPPP